MVAQDRHGGIPQVRCNDVNVLVAVEVGGGQVEGVPESDRLFEFEAVQACVSQKRDTVGGADDKVDPSVTVDIRGGDR